MDANCAKPVDISLQKTIGLILVILVPSVRMLQVPLQKLAHLAPKDFTKTNQPRNLANRVALGNTPTNCQS